MTDPASRPDDPLASAVATVAPEPIADGLLDRSFRDVRARLFGGSPLPDRIGRFIVLEELGRGGMGTVYAVYDPQLDRKLALKSVLDVADATDTLAEARALAQVHHPNVTTVFETFEANGGIHISMELIEGRPIRQWVREDSPPLDDRIRVLLQAGRGLAAVHDAGLLHRDVTPSNVMVDASGTAHLVDFGLAVQTRAPSIRASGTPGYIAPEVLDGGCPGEASDQYAFCRVAVEALELEADAHSARIVEDVHAVLSRGLRASPQARYASMSALVIALEGAAAPAPDRARSARLISLGAAVATCAIVGVSFGVTALGRWQAARVQASCNRDANAAAARWWNAQRRDSVHGALTTSGSAFAEDAAERALGRIDAHVEAWTDAHAQRCAADWSDEVKSQSRWCLDLAQVETESLLEGLASTRARAAIAATEAVTRLSSVRDCRTPEHLERRPPPPPAALRPVVLAATRSLAAATTAQRLGDYLEAKALARVVVDRVGRTGWSPLLAEARARLGQLMMMTGEREAAREQLEEAFFSAQEARLPTVAAAAALDLADCNGVRGAAFEEGERWLRHAALAIATDAGASAERLEIERLLVAGALADERGDPAAAERTLERAVTRARVADEPTELLLARALNDLALVSMASGHFESAEASLSESRAIVEATLSEQHPNVAVNLLALSQLHLEAGALHRGLDAVDRALALQENIFGERHPELLYGYNLRAVIRSRLGREREAFVDRERALSIATTAPELNPTDRVEIRSNYVTALLRAGRFEDAAARCEPLLEGAERVFGPEHPKFGVILNNCAKALSEQGETRSAADAYTRALAIVRALEGNERLAATIESNLGEALATLGEHREAKRRIARSVQTFETLFGASHPEVAIAKTKLGRALLVAGDEAAARVAFADAVTIFEHAEGTYETAALAREQLVALQG